MKSSGRSLPSRRSVLAVVVVALLVVKYLWSLSISPIPFGYDAGIYRFLILRHAEGWPPFFLAALPPWASEHPLGLFTLTTPLLRLGVPVDVLIGWAWNLFPVAVACMLAWVVSRERGANVGATLLVVFLLSVAQHAGFLAMYAKVIVALLWCAFALHAAERRQRRWILFGMLAIATHLQVGLVLGLSIASSLLFRLLCGDKKVGVFLLWTGAATAVLGGLWYVPNYGQAIVPVWSKVSASLNPVSIGIVMVLIVVVAITSACVGRVRKQLLSPRNSFVVLLLCIGLAVFGGSVFMQQMIGADTSVASGSFLSLALYIQLSLPLLALGSLGFWVSVRDGEWGSAWQWALVWCAVLVFSHFFFYLRFLLLLDFFLLPFAAVGLAHLWFYRDHVVRWLAVALVAVQCIFTLQQIATIHPQLSVAHFQAIQNAGQLVPDGAHVIVLDNFIAPWTLGLLPHAEIVAPGIFVSPEYQAWERLIYGSDAERREFFMSIPAPAFVYASEAFLTYYPPEVVGGVLAHPCLTPLSAQGLFVVACPKS